MACAAEQIKKPWRQVVSQFERKFFRLASRLKQHREVALEPPPIAAHIKGQCQCESCMMWEEFETPIDKLSKEELYKRLTMPFPWGCSVGEPGYTLEITTLFARHIS